MDMSSIELANYNQTLVPCKYCTSRMKRSKLPFHVARCHKNELTKELAREKESENQLPETPSLVPERPICNIVPNRDTENWDDSNYSTYNPLLATAHKDIIRSNYYQGLCKAEIKKCREFETLRMAQIRERNPDNFEAFHEFEAFVPIPEPGNGNETDSSEESWSESSLSIDSIRSELNEDSFNTCNSGGASASTHTNLTSFESSVADYMRNLSDEKRVKVMKKFNRIMREN